MKNVARVTTHIKYDKPDDGIGWIVFGLVFFVLENTYFGWNATAQSGAERICDILYSVALIYGGFRYLAVGVFNEIMKTFNVSLSVEPELPEHRHTTGFDK